MHTKVVVVAGPSGAGKSRLCRLVGERFGLPTINLDDFYKDGTDPTLPRRSIGPGRNIVDWDDPRSWLAEEAVDALDRLCRDGFADVPVYELARDGRVGHRLLAVGDAPLLLAEGIFAHEVVAACAARGMLAGAVCVRNHPAVTFWRRLLRDLRERRKSPWVLVRRGWALMRTEPEVVRRAVALGCVPMTPDQAHQRIAARLAEVVRGPIPAPGAENRPRNGTPCTADHTDAAHLSTRDRRGAGSRHRPTGRDRGPGATQPGR